MRGSGQSGALRHATAASCVAGLFLLSACTGSAEGKEAAESASPSVTRDAAATLSLKPRNGASGVVTSTEVAVATDGTVEKVGLSDEDGKAVPGAFRPGSRAWVPAKQLDYGTRYTVTATATKGDAEKTVTSTFTTMPRPAQVTGADPYVFDGDTVGVGMPIVIEFSKDIPKSRRAAVERRLFVKSSPAVRGSWYWWSDSEVHYRPKVYWTPGTEVTLRAAIGGLPMGYGNFGKRDRFVDFQVGDHVVTKVDAATHVARVYRNGKLIRTMPASLGKAATPTSSGTMVVMDKKAEMTFDSGTFGVPANTPGGYRQKVKWDVRFTWGGEFFHSAPWSVGDQGSRNVSHGCVNLSPSDASWFYDLAKKGDVVQIVNTGRKVGPGNGWTDWNVPWQAYLEGSALHGA
jgi:lipoprotein-anchoring transpeptidase ErfK/SrfK